MTPVFSGPKTISLDLVTPPGTPNKPAPAGPSSISTPGQGQVISTSWKGLAVGTPKPNQIVPQKLSGSGEISKTPLQSSGSGGTLNSSGGVSNQGPQTPSGLSGVNPNTTQPLTTINKPITNQQPPSAMLFGVNNPINKQTPPAAPRVIHTAFSATNTHSPVDQMEWEQLEIIHMLLKIIFEEELHLR